MGLEMGKVAVFGDGPAGLVAAEEARSQGCEVDLYVTEGGRKPRSIYTTDQGVGGNRVLERLEPGKRRDLGYVRVVTTAGTDFRVQASQTSFFMLDYPGWVRDYRSKLRRKGVHELVVPKWKYRDLRVSEGPSGVEIRVDGVGGKYDAVLDCTGVGAEVVKRADPSRRDESFFAECVYGGIYRGSLDRQEMILVLGPAGGTSWINPSMTPGYIDVVYSAFGPVGWGRDKEFWQKAPGRLRKLVQFAGGLPGVEIADGHSEEIYTGVIRNQPAGLPTTRRVYAVGEAAGMARAGFSDSFRRAATGGVWAAESVVGGRDAQEFSRQWRGKMVDELTLAASIVRAGLQSPEKLGGIFDLARTWMEGGEADRLARLFEGYVVEQKMSLELMLRCLTSRTTALAVMKTVAKMAEIKLRGVEEVSPRRWTVNDGEELVRG